MFVNFSNSSNEQQASLTSTQKPGLYQKAKQFLGRKDVQVIGVVSVVAALAWLYLKQSNNVQMTNASESLLYPNADKQCVEELSQQIKNAPSDLMTKKITDSFGGVYGFCSLPLLKRSCNQDLTKSKLENGFCMDLDSKIIYDINELTHPMMRSKYQNNHYLSIRTQVSCNQEIYPDCPNGLIGVEHLVQRTPNEWKSEAATNLFIRHLEYLSPEKTFEALSTLFKGEEYQKSLDSKILPFVIVTSYNSSSPNNETKTSLREGYSFKYLSKEYSIKLV